MPATQTAPEETLTARDIVHTAASLVTDDDSNPEYDRALVELTGYLIGFDLDNRDDLLSILRSLA